MQLFFFMDAASLDAESLGNFYVIGIEAWEVIRASDIVGVAQDSLGSYSLVEAILPLNDHAQVLIIQDHGFGMDLFDFCCSQFLDVHEKGAISIDVDHLVVRAGDFGAQGGWIAEAHGAQSEGTEEAARMTEIIILRRPHLVLSDPGGYDGFTIGQLVEHFDRFLGKDVGALLVGEGEFFLPIVDLFVPRAQVRGIEPSFGHEFQHAVQGVFQVRLDGVLNDFVFVVFGAVDIDVNDLGMFGEFAHQSGHAVVKPGAECEKRVGFGHGIVGRNRSMHAQPFHGKVVCFRIGSDPHQGCGNGDAGSLNEPVEFLRSIGRYDPAADVENRFAGFFDQFDYLDEFSIRGLLMGLVTDEIHGFGKFGGGPFLLNVFGDIDEDGSGPAG